MTLLFDNFSSKKSRIFHESVSFMDSSSSSSLSSMLLPSILKQLITILFIFSAILSSISHCSSSEEEEGSYIDCGRTYECGDLKNISYPLWGADVRPRSCGREGFEVECRNNKQPLIRINGQEFRILNISKTGNGVKIARNDLLESDGLCNENAVAITLNYSLFDYASTVRNLTLIYSCQQGSTLVGSLKNFTCDANGQTVYYTTEERYLSKPEAPIIQRNCNLVQVPVLRASIDENPDPIGREEVEQVVRQGFEVDYSQELTFKCNQCERSHGRCGSNATDGFLCYCRNNKPHDIACHPKEGINWQVKIIIGVVAGLIGVLIMCMVFFIYLRHIRKRNAPIYVKSRDISSDTFSSVKDVENRSTYHGVHIFDYDELLKATDNFDSSKELGDGGFGTVYFGKLCDGRTVAVKRLYENNFRRVEQFMNEVAILARLRHQNLVSLYGCTSRHSRELLLVYEYVPNGTVADHLHGERAKPKGLPWSTRMNIAIETASALTYLHASEIVHRDVKTNNILLDKNFSVKVADFGLSRLFPSDVTHVSTAPQGTPGYVDPDYHQCYQLTSKSDVFSFGVVLMELVSSLPAVDITRHRHEINLSTMAINKIQNHALHELVDPYLGFESDLRIRKMITAVAELAFQCLQGEKDIRPSMPDVMEELKRIQSKDYKEEEAEDKITSADEAVLLKSGPLTLSPDSVNSNWLSWATTPNESG
ncbi:LEAF RUST 10 DISEASE-RESISTANCE LOCUS RECEPTOR-LIKE PROTEIN KINASE-like 1.2 isoform X1 [Ziziphus jujuba]|uniref:non-specific serine/threonine protein kinase n=1 Tax=Ziziphus jujuba TaxID=326968 RepID=A0A6P3ZT89_ZIZJJ|nr:LEAF RUST 10 DISEASE-RESISTANCE LOCUS RECEPTOR-LIKE PROTEIN KINASE-like 1.2 isoform X1 [Ziziphus jujuba]